MATGIQISSSSGITIGTTAIDSGVDTRVLFQQGGVVQQDANFTFNNTQKRLALRASGALATDIPFLVRNSADTDNLAYVSGNGLAIIGINASSSPTLIIDPSGSARATLRGGTNQSILLNSSGFNNLNGGSGGWDIEATGGQIRQRNGSNYTLLSGNFFGIGRTPSARLDVQAQGALSTDIAFRVRNSADSSDIFNIRGNGQLEYNYNLSSTVTIPMRIVNNTTQNFAIYSNGGVAIGAGATAVNFGTTEAGISIGVNANSQRGDNIAIGNNSSSINAIGGSVYIGTYAGTYNANGGTCAIGIGRYQDPNAGDTVLVGSSSSGNAGGSSVVIGNHIQYSSVSAAKLMGIGGQLDIEAGVTITNAIALGYGVSTANRGRIRNSNSFNLFLTSQEQVLFVNDKTNIVLANKQNTVSKFDSNATNTITIHNGTPPSSNITDAFQLYSADIVAGNAAPHFRTENGNIVKLYRQDLPTNPTTAQIATFLSNLGLANLV